MSNNSTKKYLPEQQRVAYLHTPVSDSQARNSLLSDLRQVTNFLSDEKPTDGRLSWAELFSMFQEKCRERDIKPDIPGLTSANPKG